MPLVISQKSGAVTYVKSEEVLAELLGHSHFDGEDWAVGDRLIFEDGTEARIKQEPGELFHTWSDPQNSNLDDVKNAVNCPAIKSWAGLFEVIQSRTNHSGCLSVLLALAFVFGLFAGAR